jgi:hypothetical protein
LGRLRRTAGISFARLPLAVSNIDREVMVCPEKILG